MIKNTSEKLKKNVDIIMKRWVERADKEIISADHQKTLALKNSLPEYLELLATALSKTVDRTKERVQDDKDESTRLGKQHGKDRAETFNYSIEQLITEYHILRQVIFEVLEADEVLKKEDREKIICSIEQAVNDAASEYSNILRDLRELMSHSLAHDLRTPISGAKMNAQMALRRIDNKEYSITCLGRIVSSMERLDLMIENLLDAGRMRAGQGFELVLNEFDLNRMMKEVISEITLVSSNKLVLNSPGPCVGNWNEDGLRRVMENLINNAIKYGTERGPVTISLEQNNMTSIIKVHNGGNPISKEEIPELFEQFQRAKDTEGKKGWGLGLTVVKRMVEAHKGFIEVESFDKKGTTFIIKLPNDPLHSFEEQYIKKEPRSHTDLTTH